MQCSDIQQQLDRSALSAAQDPALQAHLAECDSCREYARECQLGALLRGLPVPEPSPDFESRVLAKALATAPCPRTSHSGRWLAATAASVALAVLVTWQLPGLQPASQTDEAPVVATHTIDLPPVNVMLSSDQHLAGATITVTLPDDLSLEGYPNQRELRWTTDIKAGGNKLTLPVQFSHGTEKQPASTEILITLEHQGKRKEFRVPVPLAPPTLSGLTMA